MKVTIEVDDTQGEAGLRAATVLLGRIFGVTAPNAASTPAASGPAPVPATPPQAPAAPTMPAPAAAPASVVPSPLPAAAPVASPVPPPSPAPAAAAPADVSPNGVNKATFAAAVEAYAKVYKPAGTKARFQQMADHFQQPTWQNVGAIPASQYDNVLPWFQVQQ